MSFTIQKTDVEYCKVKFNYTADTTVVASKTRQAINKIRDWPVPGFRKGHATDLALILKYKKQINSIAEQDLINTAHDDCVYDSKIKAIGYPTVDQHSLDGNNFSCELTYFTKPDFELGKYTELEIPKPVPDQSVEGMVEEVIAGLRKQCGDLKPYQDTDFVQIGDKVTIDYEVVGHTKEEFKLYIAGANFIPDFDANLYGMKAGETKEFDLAYNGEVAKCIVTVHMGLKIVPCGDDEELAKRSNMETFSKLLENVNSFSNKRIEAVYNSKLQDQATKQLIAMHKIVIPEWFLEVECKKLATVQQLNWDTLDDETKAKIKEVAHNNATLTLVLDAIESAEPEAQKTPEESLKGVAEFVASQGVQDVNGWLQDSNNSGIIQQLFARQKVEALLEWIVKKAKVVE